jgi:hypothetical protein
LYQEKSGNPVLQEGPKVFLPVGSELLHFLDGSVTTAERLELEQGEKQRLVKIKMLKNSADDVQMFDTWLCSDIKLGFFL